jgi:hypothetical protein
MLEWLGLPVAASAQAAGVDRVMVLVHWLMLVLFVGWGTFFTFVLIGSGGRRIQLRAITACAAGGRRGLRPRS